MTRTVGVDPGHTTTGLVLLESRTLLTHKLVVRGSDLDDYLSQVVAAVEDLAQFQGGADMVAVEDVRRPSWWLDGKKAPLMDLTPLLETAQVLGAVRTRFLPGHVVVVPPAHHGQVPKDLLDMPGEQGRQRCRAWLLEHYPVELVGPRTFRGDSDDLRHCRSAYDVAGAAERQARQQPLWGAR